MKSFYYVIWQDHDGIYHNYFPLGKKGESAKDDFIISIREKASSKENSYGTNFIGVIKGHANLYSTFKTTV